MLPDATEVALRVLQCNMMTFDTSMEMEQRFEIKRERRYRIHLDVI